MNVIVNKFLLAGDKFTPGMNLHIVLVDHLLKTKKEHKNLNKKGIQDIFNKTN